MIVTCTSCKTRFRVSGENVGPKGARVRCSRCKTVFVVSPDAGDRGGAGGVLQDPPSPPSFPDLEEPPPLPRAPATASPDPEIAVADPFRPSGPPSLGDPFAPPAPSPGASPFASVLSAASGTVVDPFAPSEPAARTPEDPFASAVGWDPFGVGEPVAGEAPDAPAVAAPPGPGRTVTELVGEAPPRPHIDLGSIALQERETPPPKVALPHEEPGLDVGWEMPGLPDALIGGAPFEPASPLALDEFEREREPPRIDEATDAVPRASAAEDHRPPAPAPPVAPPPPPAPEAAAVPAPTAARGGRLAGALASSLSLVLLVAVAAALFLGWRSGLVARVRGALARGTPAPLVEASAVTGGLYDTDAGSPVLVVRGRVDARISLSGPVQVKVELLDGARVVATATGFAGATATAEQLFGAGTAEAAAELRRALDARASRSLAAGASAPFLVLFPAPAPDPRGLRLRVGAEPAPHATGGG